MRHKVQEYGCDLESKEEIETHKIGNDRDDKQESEDEEEDNMKGTGKARTRRATPMRKQFWQVT